ncbi:hypothetical protein BurJ1DRAFT_3119 [Burkholderiales bacterium JOSHI_001]|nr:hypothetical protein BurJ1DRAFT_3119 [Burkholderiales bacterium JOSHI_001]
MLPEPFRRLVLRRFLAATLGWGVALLAGCASLAGPAGAPAAASAAQAAATPASGASAPRPAAAPVPGQPPAFATVIKDAKKTDGLITLWQKDEKVWLELKPEDFGKPFFLSPKISQGIGEASIFGGLMANRYGRWGRPQMVEWKRVHNLVQLMARNTAAVAADKSPEARAVAAAYSPSLVAAAPVASQPHPERKTVLVEANALFIQDTLGLAITLQRTFRQGYAFDGRNSSFAQVRSKADELVLEVSAHFATQGIGQAQPGQPGPAPSVPLSVPDARSLFLGVVYSLTRLPEEPMKPRAADARVGYFTTNTNNFGDDLARTPRQRFVNRWRLEKKDPAAALSEPVKPITFWLDRSIPLKYRDAIGKGVLAWNAAFEKIGFKDAVVVKVQPEDADFDTLDLGSASIRWMTNAQPSFGAIGPSHVDPRSGEILDADIGMESLSSRNVRAARAQILGRPVADWAALMQIGSEERLAQLMAQRANADGFDALASCQHGDMAAEQLTYAMDVLEARGEVDPDSPEAQQWVLDYLTDVTMHEVGHTLGLRHNFRSSRIYTDKQMSDLAFTRANGLAGSVMEYAPINLARPGEPATFAFQTNLGPYDFWAIEYAYKPLPAGSTAQEEAAELQRIAARSSEPQLAYGTDEDNALGLDPESLQMDLGDDPVVFANKRLDIARDLFKRQESRQLKTTADYAVLRRSLTYALRDVGRAVGVVARQVGGLRTLRDFPGTGRDPLQPVPGRDQRRALDLLVRNVLATDGLGVSPTLQRRLAPDFSERGDALFDGDSAVSTDYSVASVVLDMQRALLTHLMSDGLAQRILDNEGKLDPQADALHLSEVYSQVGNAIWSDLEGRGDIPLARRELQREHVNRLANVMLRPSGMSRADARSLLRVGAVELADRLEAAARRKGLSAEARAHLQDSALTLKQALAARLDRSGV